MMHLPDRNLPRTVNSTWFENEVRRLRLPEEKYSTSLALRKWCEAHKDHYFVPEWLLVHWGLEVNTATLGLEI
jgi:hypothetical protein